MVTDKRILIVDDDREIARLLTELLHRHDFQVAAVHNTADAKRLLHARAFDLLILDVLLPGETGIELCRQVRANSGVPIIMLTAVSELTDRVVGLELGADDYMTKPFEGRELLARIRAVLRRTAEGARESLAAKSVLSFADWRLDLRRNELRNEAGVLVPLSSAEFHILRALAQRPNVIMSREWLAEAALGAAHDPQSRSIDILVSRLRSKMRPHNASDGLIETIRGGGYALRALVI